MKVGKIMRRAEKQRSDEEFFNQVFNSADVLYLAMLNEGLPYCIPLNFVRKGNVIYLHCAPEGLKLECIRKNGHVAFSLAVDIEIDRPKSTTYYKSVCGNGSAHIVDNRDEKRAALGMLAERYNARCKQPAPDVDVTRTAIVRIDIADLTGKCNQGKSSAHPQ